MTLWTDGYVADIGYTSNFYRETTPRWLVTISTLAGRRAPDIDLPFNYLELGCGQGFNAALIAATHANGKFWALDFNPTHIANARQLARNAKLSNLECLEMSFEEFAESPPDTYPKFDFIVLHGIYSWVGPRHRDAVLRILDRFLNTGGIVYVSYNSHPGWSPFLAAHRLIHSYVKHTPLSSDQKVQQGLAFLTKLRDMGAKSFKSNPEMGRITEMMQKQNPSYLAHELMNSSWEIHHFADVAEEMGKVKLDYIGTSTLLENFDTVSIPPELRPTIAELAELPVRETVKDFARNQNFRRDIYARGAPVLTPLEFSTAFGKIGLLPLRTCPEGEIKFKTPLGEATGKDSVYRPLIEVMADKVLNYKLATSYPELANEPYGKILESLALLISSEYAHPAQGNTDAKSIQMNRKAAKEFNVAVINNVLHGHDFSFLAAPDIGTGVTANIVDMVAVGKLIENPRLSGKELAEAIWIACEACDRRFVRNGKALEAREENLEEIIQKLAEFERDKLPAWRRLGIL